MSRWTRFGGVAVGSEVGVLGASQIGGTDKKNSADDDDVSVLPLLHGIDQTDSWDGVSSWIQALLSWRGTTRTYTDPNPAKATKDGTGTATANILQWVLWPCPPDGMTDRRLVAATTAATWSVARRQGSTMQISQRSQAVVAWMDAWDAATHEHDTTPALIATTKSAAATPNEVGRAAESKLP